jgi:hypothetical protein
MLQQSLEHSHPTAWSMQFGEKTTTSPNRTTRLVSTAWKAYQAEDP